VNGWSFSPSGEKAQCTVSAPTVLFYFIISSDDDDASSAAARGRGSLYIILYWTTDSIKAMTDRRRSSVQNSTMVE
jgi:hypothetical protein